MNLFFFHFLLVNLLIFLIEIPHFHCQPAFYETQSKIVAGSNAIGPNIFTSSDGLILLSSGSCSTYSVSLFSRPSLSSPFTFVSSVVPISLTAVNGFGYFCSMSRDGLLVIALNGFNSGSLIIPALIIFSRLSTSVAFSDFQGIPVIEIFKDFSSISQPSSNNLAFAAGVARANSNVGGVYIFQRANTGAVFAQFGGLLSGTGNAGISSQGSSVAMTPDGLVVVSGGSNDNYDSASQAAIGAIWV